MDSHIYIMERGNNMIKWKKYICVALSAAMMATLMTGCGDTSNDSASSDKAEATTESASDTLQDALTAEISAIQIMQTRRRRFTFLRMRMAQQMM